LKEKWNTLTAEEKEPFEKMKRDHLAKQGLMQECITDALQKEKGGNCVRSYASLAKVTSLYPYLYAFVWNLPFNTYRLSIPSIISRQQVTGATKALLRIGSRANQTSVCIRRESVLDCLM
jgi:hypothetical protein